MSATDEQYGQLDTGYPHTLRPELHKALEARGIDYWVAQGITFWNRDDGCECLAYGYKADGVPKLAIKVVGFTDPEQAIAATVGSDKVEAVLRKLIAQLGVAADFHFARKYVDCIVEEYAGKLATLGSGTCHEVKIDRYYRGCSECGYIWEHMYAVGWQVGPKFCPSCGRRVVTS